MSVTKQIETFHQHRWLAEAEISLINEEDLHFFLLEFRDKIALDDYFSLVQKPGIPVISYPQKSYLTKISSILYELYTRAYQKIGHF